MSADKTVLSDSTVECQVSYSGSNLPILDQSHNDAAMEEDDYSQEREVEESKEEPVNKELFKVQIPSEIWSKLPALCLLNFAPRRASELPLDRTNSAQASATESEFNSGRWTAHEHERFLEAIEMYGKDWKKVQKFVGTRTST